MKHLEVSMGDLIIKRAENGFAVLSPSNKIEGEYSLLVYEFDEEEQDHRVAEAEALLRLLDDHFSDFFQNKHGGGLSVRVERHGTSSVGEEES